MLKSPSQRRFLQCSDAEVRTACISMCFKRKTAGNYQIVAQCHPGAPMVIVELIMWLLRDITVLSTFQKVLISILFTVQEGRRHYWLCGEVSAEVQWPHSLQSPARPPALHEGGHPLLRQRRHPGLHLHPL